MRGLVLLAIPVLLVLGYCTFDATRPDLLLNPIDRVIHLADPLWEGWYSSEVSLVPAIFSEGEAFASVEKKLVDAGYSYDLRQDDVGKPVHLFAKQGTSFFLDCRDFAVLVRVDAEGKLLSAGARKQRNRCVL